MLPVKSKYKVAKRLGAAIFPQTQTQKFVLAEARGTKKRSRGGRGGGTDYGRQLLEKQRVRYTYGITEGQLAKYAKKAYTEANPSLSLHRALEERLDSVLYRSGFATTRRAARQMASHGHITINGVRTTVPSRALRKGDVFTVREGSRKSPLFGHLNDAEAEKRPVPTWLEVDYALMRGTITGEPALEATDAVLEYPAVFEFYSR